MVADRAQFAAEGLGERAARGLGPGSACLEHKWRPAEQAVGVSEGVGVVFGEPGQARGEGGLGARLSLGVVEMGPALFEEGQFDAVDVQVRRWEGNGQ